PQRAAAPEAGRDLLHAAGRGRHHADPAADAHHVTGTERRLGDRAAVDVHAVPAPQIGDHDAAVMTALAQGRVPSRDIGPLEMNGRARVSSQQELALPVPAERGRRLTLAREAPYDEEV